MTLKDPRGRHAEPLGLTHGKVDMIIPDVGVLNSQPASSFSMTYTAVTFSPRVRLRVDTSRAVNTPSVLYGGVAMSCTDKGKHSAADIEHHFEIHHPPAGSQVISGVFSEDIFYQVRLFDDAWLTS